MDKINSGAVNENWILKIIFYLIRCKISIGIKIKNFFTYFSFIYLFEY
jgi:hypothetical protein